MEAATTYALLRQFPPALKLYDRHRTSRQPIQMNGIKGCDLSGSGNLPEAAKLLSEVDWQTRVENTFRVKINQLTLERNYGEAIRLVQT